MDLPVRGGECHMLNSNMYSRCAAIVSQFARLGAAALPVCAIAATCGSKDGAFAVGTESNPSGSLLTRKEAPRDALRNWQKGSLLDKLARENAAQVSAERMVIVVIGITGESVLKLCLIPGTGAPREVCAHPTGPMVHCIHCGLRC